MQLSDFLFTKLEADTAIPSFQCSDNDLNDFLLFDSKKYYEDLLAVTYLFIDVQHCQVAAYFSMLNDKVAYNPTDNNIWNKINRHISNNKRKRSYPSVKIGRLAVSTLYVNCGIGSSILQFIKWSMVNNCRTGCRFITVDAYAAATDFYIKNGFSFFTKEDIGDKTRLMYFDLKSFKATV